jgi:hypothetical protein
LHFPIFYYQAFFGGQVNEWRLSGGRQEGRDGSRKWFFPPYNCGIQTPCSTKGNFQVGFGQHPDEPVQTHFQEKFTTRFPEIFQEDRFSRTGSPVKAKDGGMSLYLNILNNQSNARHLFGWAGFQIKEIAA